MHCKILFSLHTFSNRCMFYMTYRTPTIIVVIWSCLRTMMALTLRRFFFLIALQRSADKVVGGKDPWSHHFKGPALQMEWIPVFPLFQKNPQQIYFRHHFIMTKHFLSYKNRPIWACLNIFRLNRVRVAILFGYDFLCNYLPFSKGLMNFGCLEPSQKMLDFWIYLLVKRRLTEFIRVPPYEFLVFLRNFIFLPKQANFLGLTPNQPF